MVCTSVQYGHGKADFDGVGLEPVGDRTLNEAGVRFDLGQLDGLVLPPGGHGECGHGHGCDQSQGQNKYDNLSHKITPLLLPSQPGRQPGCKHCYPSKTDTEHRSTSHIHPLQMPW